MTSPRVHSMREILRGGHVLRWHARPDVPSETVAHHHAQVAQIVVWLTQGAASAELLRAALHHDSGELYAGDLPYPVKVALPEVARAHAAYEDECRARIVAPWVLSAREAAVLALADRLAAVSHVAATAKRSLGHADWQEDARQIADAAAALGIPDVEDLLEDFFARGLT
jgi:5'-deoxynucleotidase YfbR-like HD superfamily hydrolase